MDAPSPDLTLPLGVKTLLESGAGVLFVGAGIGWSAKNKQGDSMPDARRLAAEMASHFGIDAGENPSLAKVAEVVELRKKRTALDA